MSSFSDRDLQAVRSSGLFDPDWYTQTYDDVAALGMDPVEHYLWIGAKLGRDPSPKFSTAAYLALYPDVGRTGVNPLLHYIHWGKAEGRRLPVTDRCPAPVSTAMLSNLRLIRWDRRSRP